MENRNRRPIVEFGSIRSPSVYIKHATK